METGERVMVFAWFDSNEVEDFAILLAKDFCQRVPYSILEQSNSRNGRALNSVLLSIDLQVDKFFGDKSINIYKKACFGNKLKWALKGANYPEVFVDRFVLRLLSRISGHGHRAK